MLVYLRLAQLASTVLMICDADDRERILPRTYLDVISEQDRCGLVVSQAARIRRSSSGHVDGCAANGARSASRRQTVRVMHILKPSST